MGLLPAALLFATTCTSTQLIYCFCVFPRECHHCLIPKQCFLCFWHSASEGNSLTQQEPAPCSGIYQSSMMSPGQLLHASRLCGSKGISFQEAPPACPLPSADRRGQDTSPPAAMGPRSRWLPCPCALSPLWGPLPLLVDRCWWTYLLPSPRLDSFSYKPKQTVIYQCASYSSVLSYV